MSLSTCFINYLRTFSRKCMTQGVSEQVKKTLLDYLGVTVAGYSMANYTQGDESLFGFSDKKVCVIGSSLETDTLQAAFQNGFHAHVCELDDGHRFGMLHLAAPIYSAMVSAAAKIQLSWESFFKGAVTGYEAAIKLARLMQPDHKLRGYHATGTCGTIGAAMAVCVALDYNLEQMCSTLAMAATSAAGLLEVIDDGSQLKPYNIGRAAMDGLQAALIGKSGLIPPDDVIGGKRGFLNVLSGVQLDETAFQKSLEEERPEILNIYFKPYAACRHSHPAIEAALGLADQITDLKEIDRIFVETYKLAVTGHDHAEIRGASSAKMSTCYGVACALQYNQCNIEHYSESRLAEIIQSGLIEKITVREDPSMSKESPAVRAARVTITLKNGLCMRKEIDHPKGEPENPMSDEEIIQKMDSLFRMTGRNDARAIAKQILCLEKTPYDIIRSTMKNVKEEHHNDG